MRLDQTTSDGWMWGTSDKFGDGQRSGLVQINYLWPRRVIADLIYDYRNLRVEWIIGVLLNHLAD